MRILTEVRNKCKIYQEVMVKHNTTRRAGTAIVEVFKLFAFHWAGTYFPHCQTS